MKYLRRYHLHHKAIRNLVDLSWSSPILDAMGSYRLLLAYFVVASHLNVMLYFHPGVVAVVSFYVLSGYVMTALIQKHFCELSEIPRFYLDRMLRIGPQYWFYLTIGFSALSLGFFLRPNYSYSACTPWKIFANFVIAPMQFGYIDQLWMCSLIPHDWSLAVEVAFYAMIPFLIILDIRGSAFLVSLAVFIAAFLGLLDTEWHTYRLITGTLFIFICGSYLRSSRTSLEHFAPWAVWSAAALGMVFTYGFPTLDVPYVRSVFAGLLIAVPAVTVLAGLKFGRLDGFAGNVSYGVFLNHLLIQWLLPEWIGASNIFVRLVIVVAISTVCAATSYMLIEHPILIFRRYFLRERKLPKTTKLGAAS